MGIWGPVIPFPIIPAAAFVAHHTGKIITFAAIGPNFYTPGAGSTYTATYDPSTG